MSANGGSLAASHIDRLYSVASGGGYPAGVLRAFGMGGWAFYEDTGGGNFTEPQGDSGTLTQSGGVYTYTSPSGDTRTFNSSGMQTGWKSADGAALLTFTYTNADGDGLTDDLATQTSIDGSLATFTYASNKLRTIDSRNVVAKLEGTDPVLKDEYVVYSAHWDHLGVGAPVNGDNIYNGALDNATGVATVL